MLLTLLSVVELITLFNGHLIVSYALVGLVLGSLFFFPDIGLLKTTKGTA